VLSRVCPAGGTLAAQPVHELLELAGVASVGGVHVLPLGHQPQPVVSVEAAGPQDPFERLAGRRVDDQELVFVELHLERLLRMHHGDSGTAIVEKEIVEFPQQALEHQPLDALAGELPDAD